MDYFVNEEGGPDTSSSKVGREGGSEGELFSELVDWSIGPLRCCHLGFDSRPDSRRSKQLISFLVIFS